MRVKYDKSVTIHPIVIYHGGERIDAFSIVEAEDLIGQLERAVEKADAAVHERRAQDIADEVREVFVAAMVGAANALGRPRLAQKKKEV